jgi:hypothetical protein
LLFMFLVLIFFFHFFLVISIVRKVSIHNISENIISFVCNSFEVTINFFLSTPKYAFPYIPVFEIFLRTPCHASRCPFIASFSKVNYWPLSKA